MGKNESLNVTAMVRSSDLLFPVGSGTWDRPLLWARRRRCLESFGNEIIINLQKSFFTTINSI